MTWPERTNHYTLDISAAPWLDLGGQPEPPEQSPKLGWMTQGLAIDPHDSDRMMYGTGATIYGTTNLTDIDDGGTVDLQVMAEGLEETAANALIKPPGGKLHSGLLDIGGFRHESVDEVPAATFEQPYHEHTTDMDYAELEPDRLVRVGDTDSEGASHIGLSTDGGQNWWPGSEPAGVTGGGSVAISADGRSLLWSPDGTGVHHATSLGGTFAPSSGIPEGAAVAADRVTPGLYYAYADGSFYVSNDGGATFEETVTGLPDDGFVGFDSVPGEAGHVWLAGETGLLRSTDAGASFSAIPEISWAYNVGFGAPAPGQTHPAIFAVATIDGTTGLFRSDDTGHSWVRINDDAHQWGNMGAAITGDPDVHGRVYLGTNGRGVLHGEPSDTGPQPTPTATSTPTPSPTPTPGPTSTSTPTPGPDGACTVEYTITNEWSTGFQGNVAVTNNGAESIETWTLTWAFSAGQQIQQLWNGQYSQTGPDVSVTQADWNATIRPQETITIGFLGSRESTNPEPDEFVLDGHRCQLK